MRMRGMLNRKIATAHSVIQRAVKTLRSVAEGLHNNKTPPEARDLALIRNDLETLQDWREKESPNMEAKQT